MAWRRATVAVVPSLWSDPCPTVAIEAMLAGTPVVASAVGGLPFLVPHERAGVCIPPGDPVALRESLTRLLADEGRRQAMGRYGRVWARQFLGSRVVPRIEALYEELAGGPGAAGGSGLNAAAAPDHAAVSTHLAGATNKEQP
jgi:glycogen(starch) synthase